MADIICGKCPNCGAQMEPESIYGKKVCRCPDCAFKTKGKEKNSIKLNYKEIKKE
jgi:DNA-directed RNA polymerase subunit RPC12/RpoP